MSEQEIREEIERLQKELDKQESMSSWTRERLSKLREELRIFTEQARTGPRILKG